MSGNNSESSGRPSRSTRPWTLPSNTGPRIGRVGGWSTSSSSSSRSASGARIATLGDITSGGGGGGPSMGGGFPSFGQPQGGHDDEDDEDEDENRGGESWFAGGERSGISIQNPDRPGQAPGGDLVRELLHRAAQAGPPPGAPEGSHRSLAFSGGGHTLGSDEVDSTYIPDPDAPTAEEPEQETAIRHVTFWRNGFSVEDGELMSYEDPQHSQILEEIHAGLAPPRILNVQPGQPVELRVVKRLHEDYVPTTKSRTAAIFSGQGQRLGSPVPNFAPTSSTSSSSHSIPGSFPGQATSSQAQHDPQSISHRFEVNTDLPSTSVQIRLADGTRMVCRMNLTHTVRDIRNFINASRPENNSRPYTIGTTFPNRLLDDDTQTIEAAGLANSVVVQRWV